MTVRVKICGLTRKEDIDSAIDSGADAVGFIFGYPSSPRNLNFHKLNELVTSVPSFVSTVVVSPASNRSLQRVASIKPNFLQLYEDKKPSSKTSSNFTSVIQTVRPSGDKNSLIKRSVSLAKNTRGIIFDASSTSPYSGKRKEPAGTLEENWTMAEKIRAAIDPIPLILGGGLTVENVAEAVRKVRPYAVDVSSGVESQPGIKDAKKIRQFIQNAKSAVRS